MSERHELESGEVEVRLQEAGEAKTDGAGETQVPRQFSEMRMGFRRARCSRPQPAHGGVRHLRVVVGGGGAGSVRGGDRQLRGAGGGVDGSGAAVPHVARDVVPAYLPLRSSSRTILAIIFRVSKTPVPLLAIASKIGSPLVCSAFFISSTGMAVGRSRLLNCRT